MQLLQRVFCLAAAALNAFLRYVQSEVPERMLQCQKIMAMPLRRRVQAPVGYLSKDELTQVLAHPDLSTQAGRRDAVMLSMHLLQSGVSLDIIRDFLGHVDVRTTQIYARANLEMKRRALEKVADDTPLPALPSWQQNKTLLDWLRSL